MVQTSIIICFFESRPGGDENQSSSQHIRWCQQRVTQTNSRAACHCPHATSTGSSQGSHRKETHWPPYQQLQSVSRASWWGQRLESHFQQGAARIPGTRSETSIFWWGKNHHKNYQHRSILSIEIWLWRMKRNNENNCQIPTFPSGLGFSRLARYQ